MNSKILTSLLVIICSMNFSCVNQTPENKILFQDDFESYQIGSTPTGEWAKSGAGTVNIDKSKSVSGNQSAHFTTGEGYKNHAFLKLEGIFPVENNQYYGSMQMYVQEASPDGVHWTMLQSSGQVKGKTYRSEVRYGGQHQKQFMANYETMGVQSDCWQHSSVQIPEQEWFSVQWFFDGVSNSMKFWLNEKLLSEISLNQQGQGCAKHDTNDQWLFPIFEKLDIGWVDYQSGGGTRHVWIDDVTIWQER